MTDLENIIIPWYERNKRDFPWRHTKNPYYIWICEVMSQQTQMARVVEYYHRFIALFPTLSDLANATENDLLKSWEGLGYYSRVRNMQTAAQQILTEFGGTFPHNYHDLLKLKGIGSYTAAAIASIAFGEPVAAVDGNVLRVYTRLQELNEDILRQKTKTIVQSALETEMTAKNPSSFNQGMIELGATICTPQNPFCTTCPLKDKCKAYKHKTTNVYPIKKKKAKQVEEAYYTFIVMLDDGKIFLQKEADKQLLYGLYALPQYENDDNLNEVIRALSEQLSYRVNIEDLLLKGQYKHVFSHKIWLMDVYVLQLHPEKNAIATDDFYDITIVPLANAHRKVIQDETHES